MKSVNKTHIKEITWNEARKKVHSINPLLCGIIDEINPSMPVKELKYPYGMTIADDRFLYLPDGEGGITSRDVNDFPYFINVDKNLESFLITSEKYVPDLIYRKGDIFPKTMDIYDFEIKEFKYKPNSPFNFISGVRNIVITSLFGKTDGYINLQKEFNIDKNISPSDPVMHFEIIKSMTDKIKLNWRSTLYMLDLDWVHEIKSNPSWWKLREYLYRQCISTSMQRSNTQYLDYALTEILTTNNINIKPYSIETIKQLFSIISGNMTGFRIATDESSMPLFDIMKFIDKSCNPLTLPIIAESASIRECKTGLIYSSLESTRHELNSKKSFRSGFYLNEIAENVDLILHELSTHQLALDSIYGNSKDILKLNYFSEKGKKTGNIHINPASELFKYDDNIHKIYSLYTSDIENDDRKMGVKSSFTKCLISIDTNGVKS